MTARFRALRTTAGLGALAVALAACGGSSGTSDTGGSPVRGGTLKWIGASDVDHLDTVAGYTTVANVLFRAFTRQLFSYQASNDVAGAGTPVRADAAVDTPSLVNGGISADGKTITIRVRPGIMWNTAPPREVTAADFVRGIKRNCNPDPNGAGGNLPYYTNTIAGFKAFCDGFAKVKDNAAAIADYQNKNDVSGMKALDAHTLVFTLNEPAPDFFNILAMPFASAAPAEYDAYVPDSDQFRQHTLSDGPYMISKYVATKEIDLVRNPNWKADTDPLRKAYVDGIQVVEGQASPDAAEQQVDAGTADLLWDHAVPSATIAQLKAAKSDRLGIFPSPNSNPFLRFNFQSPNNNRAMANLHIRQAIEYAINKTSIAKIYGGLAINKPLHTTIPPGSVGYQDANPYPTPNDQGDPAKCKALLAQGLKEIGLSSLQPLQYVFRNSSNHPKVTQSVSADLAACGIPTKITGTTPADFYGKFLSSPDTSKQGKWDIAAPGWQVDWPGNNGRALVDPLFSSSQCGSNGVNYGCFSDPRTDALIKQAESAPSQQAAAGYWTQADQQIMSQAAFVPFQQQLQPLTRSARVHNALFYVTSALYDPTNIWLSTK